MHPFCTVRTDQRTCCQSIQRFLNIPSTHGTGKPILFVRFIKCILRFAFVFLTVPEFSVFRIVGCETVTLRHYLACAGRTATTSLEATDRGLPFMPTIRTFPPDLAWRTGKSIIRALSISWTPVLDGFRTNHTNWICLVLPFSTFRANRISFGSIINGSFPFVSAFGTFPVHYFFRACKNFIRPYRVFVPVPFPGKTGVIIL